MEIREDTTQDRSLEGISQHFTAFEIFFLFFVLKLTFLKYLKIYSLIFPCGDGRKK